MPTKTLATRPEASYGWAIADPQKSSGLSQAAAADLKYNYGIDASKGIPSYDQIKKMEQRARSTADALKWFGAMPQKNSMAHLMSGESWEDYRNSKLNSLYSTVGHGLSRGQFDRYVMRDPVTEAMPQMSPNQRKSLSGMPEWLGNAAAVSMQQQTDQAIRKRIAEANRAGVDPFAYVAQKMGGDDPEWLKNRVSAIMSIDRTQREGVLPTYARLLSDPKSWSNPYLSRYYDGPNASQVSFKGGPWSAVGATNRSKEWGGEDLADDVFEYYKSIARPGQLGGVVGALAENPYAKAVTFNDQQAYFTPYDYAIHGVTPSGSLRTEISALDPRFWQTQGNLQQLPDGTWGFITGTNPYAGGSNPTQTLDPENVALQYKYNKSGGMFGGGFGGLLGKAMSFVNPWLGVPGMVAAGASMLDKDKPNVPSSTGFQPTVAPQWNPSPAPRSSGLPAAVADNSRYRVPQPGDLDYPDYLRTLASGREWFRYE